jgi:hypothetical protein
MIFDPPKKILADARGWNPVAGNASGVSRPGEGGTPAALRQ